MRQLLTQKGKIILEELPAPLIDSHEILVQISYSCISSGTELSSLNSASRNIIQKLIDKPKSIEQVLKLLRTEGVSSTIQRVKDVLYATSPIGYSASGIVLEVGSNIRNFKPGDHVACAGAGIANHAEFIAVPENLTVKVPSNVSLQLGATVTLGSIALQGVRRTSPQIGDTVVVTGLGILGQISLQLLKANGCSVIGIDHNPVRIEKALSLGLGKGLNAAKDDLAKEISNLTGGQGADAVIITAAGKDSSIINGAMKLCRKKGKVTIVGDIGLNLEREEFYKKELDLLISTSYGPGRYDQEYEIKGKDYPYAYVRWTENRNMEAYLQLISENKINIEPLVEEICPLENAPTFYTELQDSPNRPLIALIEYGKQAKTSPAVRTEIRPIARTTSDKINVGLIGPGSFAQSMHLPNLQKLKKYNIHAIASKTGHRAKDIAKRYGAAYATTDYKEILQDKNIQMVFIATRHNLHAAIATEAAAAGKAVFLEKPMALNKEELLNLTAVLEKTQVPFMIGYNRRFSPFMTEIKRHVQNRQNPFILDYRMNAGFIPLDHWVHSLEGGGRNIGEACHIYDIFNFLTESPVKRISAYSVSPKEKKFSHRDNFVATLQYEDGSICNLIYTAMGTSQVEKEQMDIYFDEKIIRLNDYKELSIVNSTVQNKRSQSPQKGHYEQLLAFAQSVQNKQTGPIPLWQLTQASEISFVVENDITAA